MRRQQAQPTTNTAYDYEHMEQTFRRGRLRSVMVGCFGLLVMTVILAIMVVVLFS